MIVLEILPNRTSETLKAIIHQVIDPYASVITDQHASYVNLSRSKSHLLEPAKNPLQHFWVNHSSEFAHRKYTFVHTNSIERQWRSLKSSISSVKISIVNPVRLQEYLDSYMLRLIFKEGHSLYELMLRLLKDYYADNAFLIFK